MSVWVRVTVVTGLVCALSGGVMSADQGIDEGTWLRTEKAGITIEYQDDTKALATELLPKVVELHKAANSPESKAVLAKRKQQVDTLIKHKAEIISMVAAELSIPKGDKILETMFTANVPTVSALAAGDTLDSAGLKAVQEKPVYRIWRKADLRRLLLAGHSIPMFSYDAATDTIAFQLSFGARTEPNGVSRATPPVEVDALPLVIKSPAEDKDRRTESAQLLDTAKHYVDLLYRADTDGTKGTLIAALHEMSEGSMLAALHLDGAFRRWFCEGASTYVAWQCIAKVLGQSVADEFLQASTDQSAQKRKDEVDLLNWRAAEWEDGMPETDSDLSNAYYALAAQEVFGLVKRHGPGTISSICKEIAGSSSTQRGGTQILDAIRKVTGEDMRTVLAGYGAKSKDEFRGVAVLKVTTGFDERKNGRWVLSQETTDVPGIADGNHATSVIIAYETNGIPLRVRFETYVLEDSGNLQKWGDDEKTFTRPSGVAEFIRPVDTQSTRIITMVARLYLNGRRFRDVRYRWVPQTKPGLKIDLDTPSLSPSLGSK